MNLVLMGKNGQACIAHIALTHQTDVNSGQLSRRRMVVKKEWSYRISKGESIEARETAISFRLNNRERITFEN